MSERGSTLSTSLYTVYIMLACSVAISKKMCRRCLTITKGELGHNIKWFLGIHTIGSEKLKVRDD